jgi:hypothetical protein
MKKLSNLFILIGLGTIIASCNQRNRHTIISTENNQTKIRVEYAGRVIFNDDRTAILDISKDGYFKYERNDEALNAENDGKGHVIYELNDGTKTTILNDEGKQLLGEAIREIDKAGHKH